MNEHELREQICKVGKLMHQFQLVDGNSGNISARLGDNRVLITPSGCCKGFITPDDLLIIDLDGQKISGAGKPSTETPMHTEVYRQRADVGGVVHAHPGYAVALTMAGITFQQYTVPEVVLLLGEIPTAEYATPSSDEDREAVRDLIQHHNALMLAYHGSLTVGQDPWQAYMRLENLEHTAKLIFRVHQLGGAAPLPDFQLQKLRDLRKHYGW